MKFFFIFEQIWIQVAKYSEFWSLNINRVPQHVPSLTTPPSVPPHVPSLTTPPSVPPHVPSLTTPPSVPPHVPSLTTPPSVPPHVPSLTTPPRSPHNHVQNKHVLHRCRLLYLHAVQRVLKTHWDSCRLDWT